jgi:hypothetical protein
MALERMASGMDSVPVVDDFTEQCIGHIDRASMLETLARLFPQLNEFTELTVTCPPRHYSASEIARAVEDADAHLLNLNVMAGTEPDSPTTVMLRVNHSRGESVAHSLARYGYDTVEIAGDPGLLNTDMMDRINELLHYLQV